MNHVLNCLESEGLAGNCSGTVVLLNVAFLRLSYFFPIALWRCHITLCVPCPEAVERVKVLCLVSASWGTQPGNFLIPVQKKHRIRSQGGGIKGPKRFVLGGHFGSLDVQAHNQNPPPPPSLQAAKMGETNGFLFGLTPKSSFCCCDGAASPRPSFAGSWYNSPCGVRDLLGCSLFPAHESH